MLSLLALRPLNLLLPPPGILLPQTYASLGPSHHLDVGSDGTFLGRLFLVIYLMQLPLAQAHPFIFV